MHFIFIVITNIVRSKSVLRTAPHFHPKPTLTGICFLPDQSPHEDEDDP